MFLQQQQTINEVYSISANQPELRQKHPWPPITKHLRMVFQIREGRHHNNTNLICVLWQQPVLVRQTDDMTLIKMNWAFWNHTSFSGLYDEIFDFDLRNCCQQSSLYLNPSLLQTQQETQQYEREQKWKIEQDPRELKTLILKLGWCRDDHTNGNCNLQWM